MFPSWHNTVAVVDLRQSAGWQHKISVEDLQSTETCEPDHIFHDVSVKTQCLYQAASKTDLPVDYFLCLYWICKCIH